jgi:hypothetical protein
MYLQAVEVWAAEQKKGHFNKLLDTLWSMGFTVKVPNPVCRMEIILVKKGFEKIDEQDPISTTPDIQVVYRKEPPPVELSS